jgi:hypothetical protein
MSQRFGSTKWTAFGLIWDADLPLEHFVPCDGRADVLVRQVDTLPDRQEVTTVNRGAIYADGIRFAWEDQVTFDMIDGNRINYMPGPGWRGVMPWAFYSTVTALFLAWRGILPFHACAVGIDGQALLICGPSGVGKSSLTAGLALRGATLIADDLTAVQMHAESGFSVLPGRRAMRLFPRQAKWMDGWTQIEAPNDPRGKLLVSPPTDYISAALPLAGVLALGVAAPPQNLIERFVFLDHQLLRPKWMAALPCKQHRRSQLVQLSRHLPVATMPALGMIDDAEMQTVIDRALSFVRPLLA